MPEDAAGLDRGAYAADEYNRDYDSARGRAYDDFEYERGSSAGREERHITRADEDVRFGKQEVDTETVETDVRRERFDVRGEDEATGESRSRRNRRE